jgi:exopolyphosphatase/guanosine-5'-triphosphate,3'-diphosphate pyrophosphatase
LKQQRDTRHQRPVAVIDLGSNSVRMVIFADGGRVPVPVFNEKVVCRLAAGLARTGRLREAGRACASRAVARFVAVARAMNVVRIDAVATAAIRDAEDGRGFVHKLERTHKITIEVLSGREEGMTSALGVVSGIPAADGLVCDLGGGSLEIVSVARANIGRAVTLPLGPLTLREQLSRPGRSAVRRVDEHLDAHAWMHRRRLRRLYLVGGTWRALARVHMLECGYPLRIVQHYEIPAARLRAFAGSIMSQSPGRLAQLPGISRQRAQTLPWGALVLSRLIARLGPQSVVFSAYGLREGRLYSKLAASERASDPLLHACRALAADSPGFVKAAERYFAWAKPCFRGAGGSFERLRLAACLLSNLGWREHPEYRAEDAMLRILRFPFAALDHREHVFLALAVSTRYGSAGAKAAGESVLAILDRDGRRQARRIGLSLRLAHGLSGRSAALLHTMTLSMGRKTLRVRVEKNRDWVVSDTVHRRLDLLAESFERRLDVV